MNKPDPKIPLSLGQVTISGGVLDQVPRGEIEQALFRHRMDGNAVAGAGADAPDFGLSFHHHEERVQFFIYSSRERNETIVFLPTEFRDDLAPELARAAANPDRKIPLLEGPERDRD